MNKKGQCDEARKVIYWMIAGFVISFMVVGFAFIVASYKSRLLAVSPELEAGLLALRFGSIPECFAYVDSAKNVHSGIIDISTFTDGQLFQCYHTDEENGYKEINFELELGDKKIKTNEYFDVPHYQIKRKVMIWDNGFQSGTKDLIIKAQFGLPYRPSYINK